MIIDEVWHVVNVDKATEFNKIDLEFIKNSTLAYKIETVKARAILNGNL